MANGNKSQSQSRKLTQAFIEGYERTFGNKDKDKEESQKARAEIFLDAILMGK